VILGESHTAGFKAEAVKQVIERGLGAVEVSNRLGVSDNSLYLWFQEAK
jgi:transposase